MPIKFKVLADAGYFISCWEGHSSHTEVLDQYRQFFEEFNWGSLNELVDVSRAELSAQETYTLLELGQLWQGFYQRQGVEQVKTAVYMPDDGMQRLVELYSAFVYDSPEQVLRFSQRAEAVRWLTAR